MTVIDFGRCGPIDMPTYPVRIESYWGLVLAKPLASCAGCHQVVIYETANGGVIEATQCRCDEPVVGQD